MIETKTVELEKGVIHAEEVIDFTDVNDSRWAGIITLPAFRRLPLDPATRNDFYILQGDLIENLCLTHTTGTFLSRGINTSLSAGPQGAKLFRYLDRSDICNDHTTVTPDQLNWYKGGAFGMQVAPLSDKTHELMLVSWIRGTQMPFHRHSRGEEIFVLTGELQDQRGRYPAGTWQRLHPTAGHAPFVETETLILLRNGHLCA